MFREGLSSRPKDVDWRSIARRCAKRCFVEASTTLWSSKKKEIIFNLTRKKRLWRPKQNDDKKHVDIKKFLTILIFKKAARRQKMFWCQPKKLTKKELASARISTAVELHDAAPNDAFSNHQLPWDRQGQPMPWRDKVAGCAQNFFARTKKSCMLKDIARTIFFLPNTFVIKCKKFCTRKNWALTEIVAIKGPTTFLR